MSRMIDRLTEFSRDAGAASAENLSARASIDVMEEHVKRGVRTRRTRIGAVAGAAALVAGAGVVVVPRVLADAELPTPPAAADTREIIGNDDGLTVYSDGSMSVVTSRGDIVDIDAPEPDRHTAFSQLTQDDLCATVDEVTFDSGWEYAQSEYVALLSFGRPQSVDDDGFHLLAQGQVVAAKSNNSWPLLAFQLDSDVDVAPHLALRSTARVVAPNGVTVGYQSLLDAAPGVTVDGDVSSGLATAHVQSRPLADHGYCVDTFGDEPFTYARRYLEVDVFLTDRNGNATLLGTHRSWSGIEAQEDVP